MYVCMYVYIYIYICTYYYIILHVLYRFVLFRTLISAGNVQNNIANNVHDITNNMDVHDITNNIGYTITIKYHYYY